MNTKPVFLVLVFVSIALISWQLQHDYDYHEDGRPKNIEHIVTNRPPSTIEHSKSQPVVSREKPFKEKRKYNTNDLDKLTYQISTNLSSLPIDKRIYVTNNFIPLANQFLRLFPTQHKEFWASNITAVSVNYGLEDYKWAVCNIKGADGPFQIIIQSEKGKNSITTYRDMTDYDISSPGTVNELKQFESGSAPSAITSAAQAKLFLAELLRKNNIRMNGYLSPPTAVPYTGCPNLGLWQVRYLPVGTPANSYFEFVIDGTGKSGPYLRYVSQMWVSTLPTTPER